MANTIQYYDTMSAHFWKLDSDATAGFSSAVFTRNFRILDVNCQVLTGAPGATMTISRIRSTVVVPLCTLDVSATGQAVLTSNIDQAVALFESGDTLRVTTSNALTVANVFIYVMQFSI